MSSTTSTLTLTPLSQTSDTDSDGCPDYKELGAAQSAGGLRDPFNPWDFFDPYKGSNSAGRHSIADVLVVVQHYNMNVGNAGYSTAYDRTALGPNVWNLGPPNGQQTIADVLAAVQQFNHSCA